MFKTSKTLRKMIDIGANLTDPMFRGVYNGNQRHHDDFADVLRRSEEIGVEKIIVTGGSLSDSKAALELAKRHENLYSTVGCHPTRCGEFQEHSDGPQEYLKDLENLAASNTHKVVAIGETGLDYARLHFCDAPTQMTYFEMQLELASRLQLPLFLHNRDSIRDFVKILEKNVQKFQSKGGVVHSFDGTAADVSRILDLGLSIGINGCSLKNEENLEAVKCIPIDKLLIETDCPWCEIRQTHASFKYVKTVMNKSKNASDPKLAVKNRNEPMNLIQVLEVLAAVRQEDVDTLCNQIYTNTSRMFFNK